MQPGDSTAALVNNIVADGAEHVVLLMRHSAREYEPGRHDLLNPLTDEGRDLAHALGEKLPKSHLVRGYTSPAERCVETAALIMAAHKASGGEARRNRVVEGLGVFYVLDQMKMFMAMQEAGGLVPFQRRWFAGEIAADILMPAETAAGLLGRLIETKLAEMPDTPQLDILVSHDFTLYLIKHLLLGQDADRYPDVIYLDGIAFFQRDGRTWIQSHHEPAIELQLPSIITT